MLQTLQRNSWLRRTLQVVLIGIPLVFLTESLIKNWQAIEEFELQFDAWRFGFATLLLMVSFCLLPLATQQTLIGLNFRLHYSVAYRGYFIAQLAKYLPGGIWVVPSRMLVFRQYGVDMVNSGIGLIIELMVLLIAGAVSFLPYLSMVGSSSSLRATFVPLLLLLASLLFLFLRFFNPISKYVLSRAGYGEVSVKFATRSIVRVLLIDLLFWQVTGVAFYMLVSSLQPLQDILWLPFGAAFSMSWVLGFLAFLVPSGFGVREGAISILLTPLLPAPLPVLVALLARLWWTLADLFSVTIALLLGRLRDAKAITDRK